MTTFANRKLTDEQRARASVVAESLFRKVDACNGEDVSLYRKAAVLVAVGQISEHDLMDAAEAVRIKSDRIRKPGAYFHRCLNEATDGRLNILLAKVRLLKIAVKNPGDLASQPGPCTSAPNCLPRPQIGAR